MNCVGYQGERSFDFTTGPGANAGFINPENEKIVHSVFTEWQKRGATCEKQTLKNWSETQMLVCDSLRKLSRALAYSQISKVQFFLSLYIATSSRQFILSLNKKNLRLFFGPCFMLFFSVSPSSIVVVFFIFPTLMWLLPVSRCLAHRAPLYL